MVDAIGYLAGILNMIAFLPQLIKTARTRKADDLSMVMLAISFITLVLYIVYGLMLNLVPVVITLSIALVILIAQIALTLKYRSRN